MSTKTEKEVTPVELLCGSYDMDPIHDAASQVGFRGGTGEGD